MASGKDPNSTVEFDHNDGPPDAQKWLRLARQHLTPGFALAQKIAGGGACEWSATGAEVRLSDGRVVLDFGSYAVPLVGHRHPRILAAVRRQLDTLPSSTRILCNPTTTSFATRLVELLDPSRLTRVWLGLNGSDVVELALKLARLRTRRKRILAVRRGFHGKTLGALAATWSPRYRAGLESHLGFTTHIEPDDPGAVGREIHAGDVAAVILEPLQGEGGVFRLDPGVLRQWVADAHAGGCYVVSDEIQSGLGRVGPLSPALDLGLQPDAILLGKALGGGVMPLSALVATPDLFRPLLDDPFLHTSTFSGHPLSCAAGLATLEVVQSLSGRGRVLADRLESALLDLRCRFPATIADVRGQGLLWGVELARPVAGQVLLELGRQGLLYAPCLDLPEMLRLVPPMVTTDAQMLRAIGMLEDACRVAERVS